MRVSLNTIKQFTSVDLPVSELVTKINRQLGGVEQTIDLNDVYKDAVIVRVVTCAKHPNADKLSVCNVDDGGTVKDAPRDNDGYIEVVCGAPNVHADMLAVWLPPKSIVPATYHDAEPFVLGARELRGVLSQGMLASPKELGLGDSYDGILELNPEEPKPNDIKIKPGASFAAAYGLDDTVIDIENKMFTHRPDCFGQLGVARELAGIQGIKFTSPDWYATSSVGTLPAASNTLDLAISNEAKKAVPRFMALVIKDVVVKPSPLWLQAELIRLGSKPINNVVDVTNYIMLLTAQPTHAYDYDKLRGHKLGARLAKKGEKVSLLNHKTYTLNETDIVIVDGDGPVGLAGIMGGGDSEVSDATTNIVLECANFDMYTVRRSSMRHGLFTDALTRFNKGQSPHQNPYVLGLLASSIVDTAGGQVASVVFDESAQLQLNPTISVSTQFINNRLGLQLSEADVTKLLENVEFVVKPGLEITAPFWRTDIELPEDIVEEVGRLHGFDKLPRVLASRTIEPAPTNQTRASKQLMRSSLKKSGANEVLTYSFVHENLLKKSGQNKDDAFRLSNALSPELQYYRLSLLPSLLDKVHPNIKSGHDEFALYELGKAHHKQNLEEDLPAETDLLEMVYASKLPLAGAPFYKIRRIVDQLCVDLGIQPSYEPIQTAMDYAGAAAFDQTRSAVIKTANGETLGILGELTSSVRSSFKLPAATAAASLSFEALHRARLAAPPRYEPLSRYPSVSQDVSLAVTSNVNYANVMKVATDTAQESAAELDCALRPISIYMPEGSDSKTITLRLTLTSQHKTLTDDDVRPTIDAIAKAAKDTLGAAIV